VLHVAVLRGVLRHAETFVDAGARVNAPGHLGNTPLQSAASHDRLGIAAFLLEHDRSEIAAFLLEHGRSKIAFLLEHGRSEIAAFLPNMGQTPPAEPGRPGPPDQGPGVTPLKNDFGQTPLDIAELMKRRM
jgi:ankyrin repeat protein